MKRRFLSTLMALVLALSLIPTAALAVEDTMPETENELDTLSEESGAETSAEFEAEVNGVPYATLQEAVAEAQGGDTVTLINDVTLNPRIGDDQEDADSLVCLMTVDQDITLDLNGYTIKWDTSLLEHEEEMPYSPCFFAVVSGGALTLVGNGTIDAEAEGTTSYCINVNGGTATIEDGNYFGAMTVAQVQTGILTVLGGTFALAKTVEVWAPDMAKYIINCIDRNYENGTAVISVRGGTFIGADPADSPEGEGTSYVADGYVSVQDGNQYTVMPLEDAAVAQIGNDYYLTLAEAISNAQDGDTIILVDDTVEDNLPYISTTVTLDLNGSTLTTNQLVTTGNLTIMDSTASAAPTVSSDYKTVSYRSGKISVTETAVYAAGGGTVTLESGCIDSSYLGAYAQGDTTGNTSINSTFNIEGGYIIAQEFAASAQGRGATLNISGGVLVARDNAVIGGNGTNTAERKLGGTTITISGGTMIGHILSNGYIACGIYHPQAGTLKITGGTIYVDGGVGIEMRGGTLDMTGGSVIATGHTSGKVGDSKVALDCYGIQIDGNSDYYDYANCKV